MECVELAPAFEPRHTSDSGSKLHALHTLRETRPPLSSVCAICSVSPKNLRKKNKIFAYIIQRAGPRSRKHGGALRTDAPRRALPAAVTEALGGTIRAIGESLVCGQCSAFSLGCNRDCGCLSDSLGLGRTKPRRT